MRMKVRQALLSAVAALSQLASSKSPIQPSAESARQNAFLIFNSVHSAMRQWGSSLHHNGMSLIPATIPRGTALYHGSAFNSTPIAPEWLAFEMEHAENFARSRPYGIWPNVSTHHDHRPRPMFDQDNAQRRLKNTPLAEENSKTIRGYFHTFLTTRPLHLLYVDGSSAGNTYLGTLDTQDYILRLLDPAEDNPFADYQRARELCALVTSWGYDGIIRMEIGFEIIWCDFSEGKGLETRSVVRSKGLEASEKWDPKKGREGVWRWARAAGERYDGIGGGRVKLDFSRMVSPLWYPVDVRNPDEKRAKEGLPRLVGMTREEREVVMGRVGAVAKAGGKGNGEGVDWQGVVDMVVARYSERLGYMASEEVEAGRFVEEVFAATNSYVEYPSAPGDVTVLNGGEGFAQECQRCAEQYLLPLEWKRASGDWTEEDEMLHAVISSVTQRICQTLFDVRTELESLQPGIVFGVASGDINDTERATMQKAVEQGRGMVRNLTAELRWTTWKKCRGCAANEVCFVAMWPFGRVSDHYEPSCFWHDNYWDLKVPTDPPGGGD
ncbi:hypothetical protein B0T16DRAFT_427351 [Cercophora newfieldiana]|uniref:Uncharacterized protein n=1 Tax=Cercophora newfieldiana TaxID=92897 RepID=A0AA40CVK0_9PEZI|nr:hypothetical protein B0T16DRAFT_427351 [Cercophora newfieldiana]